MSEQEGNRKEGNKDRSLLDLSAFKMQNLMLNMQV